MNQSHSHQDRGLPLAQTNRQLWPSLRFIPAGRRPVPEPGVVPVQCVEVLCAAHSEPRGVSPRSVRAGEQAGIRAPGQASRREGEQASQKHQTAPLPPAPAPACPPTRISPAPTPGSADAPAPAPRNVGGRPRALTEAKRAALFKLLRQGHTRRDAAKQVGVALSTVRLETRRDVHFALELRHAEVDGQEFRHVFTRLFVPGRVRLEAHPVISTPEFEREKEFLISRGLSRDWISRMRLMTLEELDDAVRVYELADRSWERQGLTAALKQARNSLCGEEIVEERFSPSGRYSRVVKTTRTLPPSESAAMERLSSLEYLINGTIPELEQLIAQVEDRPPKCKSRRKKQKPPGGTGGEERGTTSSTVQLEATVDGAGSGSVLPASSIRRRRVRRAGLAEVHSLVNVSNTSGDS